MAGKAHVIRIASRRMIATEIANGTYISVTSEPKVGEHLLVSKIDGEYNYGTITDYSPLQQGASRGFYVVTDKSEGKKVFVWLELPRDT